MVGSLLNVVCHFHNPGHRIMTSVFGRIFERWGKDRKRHKPWQPLQLQRHMHHSRLLPMFYRKTAAFA